MLTYTGTQGTTYKTLDPPLGKGGEGAIHRINDMPDYVAKIFEENKRTETRHRKLLAMLSTPLPQTAMDQITWPLDVLYRNGHFAGYVMRALKNTEQLNIIYTGKYNFSLSDKITMAKNLCAVVNVVHTAGQVCGDLNPKNICLDPKNAMVTLVDTDSYHITDKDSDKLYRCEVGLPEYLPLEVQNKMRNGLSLSTAPLPTYDKYSDLFALAVHIFALLMNGCHPFACAIDNGPVSIGQLTAYQPSVAAPQPIDNITNGFYPFISRKKGITTPIYAPSITMLPQNIQDLFRKAFVDGHTNPDRRPDAETWFRALDTMKDTLIDCVVDRYHKYPGHNPECPWCGIETIMKKPIPVLRPPRPVYHTSTKRNRINWIIMLGFLSSIAAFIGLYLINPAIQIVIGVFAVTVSRIGFLQARKKRQRGDSLAVIGMTIGVLAIVIVAVNTLILALL